MGSLPMFFFCNAMSLVSTLQRICQLQQEYSSENTPEMQERGKLIRGSLVEDIRVQENALRLALAEFGDDFDVQGKDGIGRKTEAPWVRLYSKRMSPSATEGFYVVIHFAANGTNVFVTVGCGSTVWNKGDLRAISDVELASRTAWARNIIVSKLGTLTPFDDTIHLGAKAPLPRTFEKATAFTKLIPYTEIEENSFRYYILEATKLLTILYRAHEAGADRNQSDLIDLDIENVSNPTKSNRKGQGYRLSADDRRVVELRAMEAASDWLTLHGFKVNDTSSTESYDLEASRGDENLKIEVKGTTSSNADAILMTRNEVELHRAENGRTGLILVYDIRLEMGNAGRTAHGGVVSAELNWDITKWKIEPTAFKLSRNYP